MDNSQFHIPGHVSGTSFMKPENTPLTQYTEPGFASPEHNEIQLPYDAVKSIERRITAHHLGVSEADLPQLSSVDRIRKMVNEALSGSVVSPRDHMIEKESVIGGGLLPNNSSILRQRFWFHESDVNGRGGDWFYVCVDPLGEMVACYQFSDQTIVKLVNGKTVPLAEGEDLALYDIIPKFYNAIKDNYSKVDYDLAA